MADGSHATLENVARRYPRYAFTPIRVLGLSSSSAMSAGTMFFLGSHFLDPFITGVAAVAIAWIGEKLTYTKEPGFAVQWASARAKGLLCRVIAKVWRSRGAMPPPNFQNIFEP